MTSPCRQQQCQMMVDVSCKTWMSTSEKVLLLDYLTTIKNVHPLNRDGCRLSWGSEDSTTNHPKNCNVPYQRPIESLSRTTPAPSRTHLQALGSHLSSLPLVGLVLAEACQVRATHHVQRCCRYLCRLALALNHRSSATCLCFCSTL